MNFQNNLHSQILDIFGSVQIILLFQAATAGIPRLDTGDVLGKVHRRLEGRQTLKKDSTEPATPSPTLLMIDDPFLFASSHCIKSTGYQSCPIHGNSLCACKPVHSSVPITEAVAEISLHKDASITSANALIEEKERKDSLAPISPRNLDPKRLSEPSIKTFKKGFFARGRSRSNSIDTLAACALANIDFGLTLPAKQDSLPQTITKKIKSKMTGKKKLRRVTCQVYYPTPEDKFNEFLRNSNISGTLSRDRTTTCKKHGRSKSMPEGELFGID